METKEPTTRTEPARMDYPIIGKSRAVDQLLKNIQRLAKIKSDVVIIGEAGVGKGAVAKNIVMQQNEPEPQKRFKAVNLNVVDDKELEGMLGPGGLLESIGGGTVLFEEIEEASFRNQMRKRNSRYCYCEGRAPGIAGKTKIARRPLFKAGGI